MAKGKSTMQNSKVDIRDRTYKYALMVIGLLDILPKESASQIISKQLIRSATSIGANIIEAQACNSKRDFTNYYTHSLKSANESKFWLKLLRDSGKSKYEDINPILNETIEIANILGACILTLKGRRNF
ncbi:MAG: four helix bundle protein [bacterium]